MDIKDAQNKIREFDKVRGWEDSWNLKDLSLKIQMPKFRVVAAYHLN